MGMYLGPPESILSGLRLPTPARSLFDVPLHLVYSGHESQQQNRQQQQQEQQEQQKQQKQQRQQQQQKQQQQQQQQREQQQQQQPQEKEKRAEQQQQQQQQQRHQQEQKQPEQQQAPIPPTFEQMRTLSLASAAQKTLSSKEVGFPIDFHFQDGREPDAKLFLQWFIGNKVRDQALPIPYWFSDRPLMLLLPAFFTLALISTILPRDSSSDHASSTDMHACFWSPAVLQPDSSSKSVQLDVRVVCTERIVEHSGER